MHARRSLQRTRDSLTFPIRVNLRAPGEGVGSRHSRLQFWLRNEVGEGNFAQHGFTTVSGRAVGFYFRRVEDLLAFLNMFPELELADDTGVQDHSLLSVRRRQAGSGQSG